VPEVVAGYPDRIVPVTPKAAAILKKRTFTNLYNERPAWLDNAHRDLDAAVAAAYGWPNDIGEEGALAPCSTSTASAPPPSNRRFYSILLHRTCYCARSCAIWR